MNTDKKIRWFWSWNDLAEEKWLKEMSAQGLHLKEVENPCFYIFEKGDPQNYVYKLDYRLNSAMFSHVGWLTLADKSSAQKSDEQEYFQLYKDAGWQYIGEGKGWQYFRQPEKTDETQELYTDPSSKQAKYRRKILFQLALMLLVAAFSLPPVFSLNPAITNQTSNIAAVVIVVLFAFPLIPLGLRLRRLKTQT